MRTPWRCSTATAGHARACFRTAATRCRSRSPAAWGSAAPSPIPACSGISAASPTTPRSKTVICGSPTAPASASRGNRRFTASCASSRPDEFSDTCGDAPWPASATRHKLGPTTKQDGEDAMGEWAKRAVTAAVLAGAVICGQGATSAAELTVLTNQGAVPGARELAAGFARASGHKVTVLEETGNALEQRISSGPADLMTVGPEAMDDLAKKGRVVNGTVTPYMLAGLGISVRAGSPKPNVGTVEDYKATLLAAKSIGYSRGCSGQHVAEGIEQLGLTEALKAKTVRTGGGTGPVTFFLARGDFEVGIQQTNIMVGAAGTDYVGPVPGYLNKPCPNSVALLAVSKEQEAARAMLTFMVSPEAAPLLRKVHEEPAKR